MYVKAFAACLLAGPVFADCPVAADLENGIEVTQSDGTVETYKNRGPGVVEVIGLYPDDYQGYTLLGQGVYVLEYGDIVDGRIDPETKANIAFPMAAQEMPLPMPGAIWSVKTGARDSYAIWGETIDISWGDEAQATYGDCSYRMLAGRLAYDSDGFLFEEVIHYLPDLGFGILYSYKDEDMDKSETYPIVNIVAVGG